MCDIVFGYGWLLFFFLLLLLLDRAEIWSFKNVDVPFHKLKPQIHLSSGETAVIRFASPVFLSLFVEMKQNKSNKFL